MKGEGVEVKGEKAPGGKEIQRLDRRSRIFQVASVIIAL